MNVDIKNIKCENREELKYLLTFYELDKIKNPQAALLSVSFSILGSVYAALNMLRPIRPWFSRACRSTDTHRKASPVQRACTGSKARPLPSSSFRMQARRTTSS